jgi:hypothetical protein
MDDDAPQSPDEVIDPRWNSYLKVGRGDNRTHPAKPAGSIPAFELSAQMRAIVAPWEAGEKEPYETLEALRQLAERVL